MKDRIRQHLHATPFQPFTIHLADGRIVTVSHPDFCTATSNPMTMIYVESADGKTMDIAPDMILSVERAPSVQAA